MTNEPDLPSGAEQDAAASTRAEMAALAAGLGRKRSRPEPNAWVRRFPVFLMVVAGLSIAAGGLQLAGGAEGGADILLGGVIILLGAIAMRNYSLIAAILVIFYVGADVVLGAMIGSTGFAVVRSGIYVVLTSITAWSIYAYQRERKKAGEPIGGSKWFRWGPLVLLLMATPLMLFGAFVMSTGIATSVVAGDKVSQKHIDWMKANGLLTPGEELYFFYSEGLVSIAEGGSAITNSHVGVWWPQDGVSESSWLRHADICDIQLVSAGDAMTDAVYLVHGPDAEDGFRLILSVEGGGDRTFVQEARKLQRQAVASGTLSACAERPDLSLMATITGAVADGFVGSILVSRNDKLVFHEAVGEIDQGAPSSITTFRMGSLAEVFTAAALLDCSRRRDFSLDSSIGGLWSGLEPERASTTYRQVLAHATGLPESGAGADALNGGSAARSVLAVPLESTPGKTYRHSLANHALAAAAMEQACGGRYRDRVNDVLERAGLDWTFSGASQQSSCDMPLADEAANVRREWGGLDWCTTAFDLYRWTRALFAGDIIEPDLVETMLTPVVRTDRGSVALGWQIEETPAGLQRIIARSEEANGASAVLARYPDEGVIVIVLSHGGRNANDEAWADSVHLDIEAVLEF